MAQRHSGHQAYKASSAQRWLKLLVPLTVIALDQASKAAAASLTAPVTLINGLLGLRYTENTGMAFSLLSGKSIWLGAIAAALLAFIWLLLRRYQFGTLFLAGALLVIGGGLSNALDRLFRGFVVDMVEILAFDFAVFNLADAAVCVGAAICGVLLIFLPQEWQRGEET